MLRLDVLERSALGTDPFPHVLAADVLPSARRDELDRDFPDIQVPGFFPVEEIKFGQAFRELLDDMTGRRFSEILGEKFKQPLADKPTLVTVRKWSATKDGRVHTDGPDKIVTALVYVNPAWTADGGRLRLLRAADLDTAEGPEIQPVFGNFVAFERSDHSWHGHLPFQGERRVVQIAWLANEEAIARKRRRAGRSHWLKSLWPFGRKGEPQPHATM
jgi:SM-20-related protein